MNVRSPAFWSSSASDFMAASQDNLLGILAQRQILHFRSNEAEQLRAWSDSIDCLKVALEGMPQSRGWWVLLEYPMLRLGRRIDAVILTDRAILVLEFKRGQADIAALRQADDYGLDLFDFHEFSRNHPVVPILVSGGASLEPTMMPLMWHNVVPVRQIQPQALGRELARVMAAIGAPDSPLASVDWLRGAYRPVPTIIEAACMAYSRNGVAEIAEARADQRNLRETTYAIRAAIDAAREAQRKVILFVTGIPGAGKTLCGLNAAFSHDEHASGIFLTGNPTLVHVLREALARDAIERGEDKRVARRRMETVIQALPHFRNHYLINLAEIPSEPLMVIDEAQRCWSRDYAVRKTVDKKVQLSDSEPGHLLDIAGRQLGFAGIVCLVGSGQEIHDGEGGLAEWGRALRCRPEWKVIAAPDAVEDGAERWRLGYLVGLTTESQLHLDVPVRQIRDSRAAAWVDAVLRDDVVRARAIADEGAVPFQLTRNAGVMRSALRGLARGERRAGLLASSGGKRLRADGLGVELPHMDANAVARWFLDRYPQDVRASDALEQVATEFSCQGLELDYVGLCWDADLIWNKTARHWAPRNFKGTKWQRVAATEAVENQINTYRVLLTRARYETIIFVPRGDEVDPTRSPGLYDDIAACLCACGVKMVADSIEPISPVVNRQSALI